MSRALELAGRAWDAAYDLDELRGDRAASEWCARRIRDLMREGRAEDTDALEKLATVLETRLAQERRERRQEVEV